MKPYLIVAISKLDISDFEGNLEQPILKRWISISVSVIP
jgi:hypothetical protein